VHGFGVSLGAPILFHAKQFKPELNGEISQSTKVQ
jgi:hypothetical protein